MTKYLSFLRRAPSLFFKMYNGSTFFSEETEVRRNLVLVFLLCFTVTTAFAQSRVNGKWETDRQVNSLTTTSAQRNQSVQLEVAVDGDKASGTLSLGGLGGTFYVFQGAKVIDRKVEFQPDSNPALPIWTIELVDDNTVTLYRGYLPLVGNNVLDLLSALAASPRPTSPAPVASASVTTATPGSIRGLVQDRSKATIPGVTVTVINVDTGVKLTTTTNDVGIYRFPALTSGTYTLTAALSGFAPSVVNNLRINDVEVLEDVTLEIPAPPASVNPAACKAGGMAWCFVLHRSK